MIARRRLLQASLFSAFSGAVLSPAARAGYVPYALRDTVRAWAAQVSETYALPFDWIITVLRSARYTAASARIMSQPPEKQSGRARDWQAHRLNFINNERISKGLAFIGTNTAALLQAQERWGVPAEIITAIIGVETIYGKSMGRFRVLDVLATLSFDTERRQSFFMQELASFLSLCHLTRTSPYTLFGSFAGAIGMCQFMPSNILKLGVDLDGDGKVDLRKSDQDAIGSVANFLSHAGWIKDLPVAWPCQSSERTARDLDYGGISTNTTLQNALDAGIEINTALTVPPDTPVLLVDLPHADKQALWRLGSHNFSALLEYNRSYFYAESVRELAQNLLPALKNH